MQSFFGSFRLWSQPFLLNWFKLLLSMSAFCVRDDITLINCISYTFICLFLINALLGKSHPVGMFGSTPVPPYTCWCWYSIGAFGKSCKISSTKLSKGYSYLRLEQRQARTLHRLIQEICLLSVLAWVILQRSCYIINNRSVVLYNILVLMYAGDLIVYFCDY